MIRLRSGSDRHPVGCAGRMPSPARTAPTAMQDENQSPIPPSFIEVYLPRGRARPVETRRHIAARYDLCEDLAQMLTEPAHATLFELGITEALVLERMYRGLLVDGSVVTAPEARWIARRLAELLGWPAPELPDPV
jgi:hypothetical protein